RGRTQPRRGDLDGLGRGGRTVCRGCTVRRTRAARLPPAAERARRTAAQARPPRRSARGIRTRRRHDPQRTRTRTAAGQGARLRLMHPLPTPAPLPPAGEGLIGYREAVAASCAIASTWIRSVTAMLKP